LFDLDWTTNRGNHIDADEIKNKKKTLQIAEDDHSHFKLCHQKRRNDLKLQKGFHQETIEIKKEDGNNDNIFINITKNKTIF